MPLSESTASSQHHNLPCLMAGVNRKSREFFTASDARNNLFLPKGQGKTFRARQAPLIHTLTNHGAELLAKKCGITRGKIDWSQKNAELKGYYKHRLFTQTVRVLLEAHTRNHKDISCIEQYDLLPTLGVSEITWTILGRGRPRIVFLPIVGVKDHGSRMAPALLLTGPPILRSGSLPS